VTAADLSEIEAELARLRDQRNAEQDRATRQWGRALAAEARALRYRARLARVLACASEDRFGWDNTSVRGRVWSRTAHRPTPERSETP